MAKGQQRDADELRQGQQRALRLLPSVSRLLEDAEVRPLLAGVAQEVATRLVSEAIEEVRRAILAGGETGAGPKERVLARLETLFAPRLRRVINATGVILHTNLGRAPVSAATAAAMGEALQHHTPLELDLESGERGGRMTEITALVRALTGAEAALVVNNNAAATALTLAALAAGCEVILSRGEAVEIGGGFRVPDVMRQSGATLVEVGTTNRTYIGDYAAALRLETAALLKVHTSNFRIVGFTHEATIAELSALGREQGIPVIHDLGSGALRNTEEFGLAHEPTVGESLRDGAGVVLFSGDKLLGGPQAGIIVGAREYVAPIARHPLARAVRADKATLAGVAATLRHYLRGEEIAAVPIWRMIAAGADELRARAERWQAALAAQGIAMSVQAARATVGGGSLPEETLPTWVLACNAEMLAARGLRVDGAAAALRRGSPPVVGRIAEERLLFDPRTVGLDEEADLLARLVAALGLGGGAAA